MPFGRTVRQMMAIVIASGAIASTAARAQDKQAFDVIERGRYLAVLGDCVACHTTPGGKPFAGGAALETPFGALVGPNITPDPATGIGSWSEADFWRVLHDGIGRGGKRLYPAMPYPAYTKISREDASAIWAYLRTLEPVRNDVQSNQLLFPFNVRPPATAGWDLINFTPGVFESDPAKSEAWNRGAYLVEGLGHCGTCHTPKNITGGDRNGEALRGGLLQDWYAPDITSDLRTGIGDWSVDDIVRYLKTGANSYDIASGPMAEVVENSTSHLLDSDLLAIATYLKDSAARSPPQATSLASDAPRMVAGKAIYEDRCAACHLSSGSGAATLFPRLAAAPLVQSTDPTSLIRVVLIGSRAGATAAAPTAPAMPSFAWNLKDTEIADVLTYIRNAWGNAAQPVEPGAVAKLRGRLVGNIPAGSR
jgi:mono/diheme cytochrome c family protein